MTVKTKKPLEAAAAATEAFSAASKATTEAATKSYEKAVLASKEQIEKASKLLFNGYDELAVLGKENLDAIVAANTVVSKGFEELSRELVGYAQASLESAASATKALFGAKTLQDVIQLNNEYAKSSFDTFLANSTKLSEMGLKVANEALEPISKRVSATVEKLAQTAQTAQAA